MKNKRGQVFLMAAIIIAGLIIGAGSAVNLARAGGSNEVFYDLADEIGFEAKRVIDYGILTGDTSPFLEDFLDNYKDYILDEELLFIFGDTNGVNGIVYTNQVLGSVGIKAGGVPNTFTIRESTSQKAKVNQVDDLITVEIRGIDYEFKLERGQNFYFVIIKGDENERFVAIK